MARSYSHRCGGGSPGMTWAARRKRHAFKHARKMKTRNEVNPDRLEVFPTRAAVVVIALLALFLFGAFVVAAHGETPDQAARWRAAKVDPRQTIALDRAVALYQRTAARYQAVSASGVPAVVIFCLHYREASNSFASSLAQGDPLTHRSIHVPKNRIPGKNPPYTWEECALDALALDKMGVKDWKTVAGALNAVEGYNGWGMWLYHRDVPTGYLWAGSSLYTRGKYVEDSRFDKLAVDKQLGVAAILLRMKERGIALPF